MKTDALVVNVLLHEKCKQIGDGLVENQNRTGCQITQPLRGGSAETATTNNEAEIQVNMHNKILRRTLSLITRKKQRRIAHVQLGFSIWRRKSTCSGYLDANVHLHHRMTPGGLLS